MRLFGISTISDGNGSVPMISPLELELSCGVWEIKRATGAFLDDQWKNHHLMYRVQGNRMLIPQPNSMA